MTIASIEKYLASAVTLIGATVLLGWGVGIHFFVQPIPGAAAMNPLTAISFVLCSLSALILLNTKYRLTTKWKLLGNGMAYLVIAIAALRILTAIPGFPIAIDQFIFPGKLAIIEADLPYFRMAYNSSFAFLFTGLALVLMYKGKGWAHWHQSLLLGAMVLALFPLVGYAFGVTEFYEVLSFAPMAVHTAACFMFLSIAMLIYSKWEGFLSVFSSRLEGGEVSRMVIPFALIVPIGVAYLWFFTHKYFAFSMELVLAGFMVSMMMASMILVWFMAAKLNERDRLKSIAEHQVKLSYYILHSSIESLQDILIFSVNEDFEYANFNLAYQEFVYHNYGNVVHMESSLDEVITDQRELERLKLHCKKALKGENHTVIEKVELENGKEQFLETRYNAILDNYGDVIGVTVVSINVTEKKKREDKIIALNKELEAYSYSVAHDLRAPLRIIDGYIGLLFKERYEDLDDEAKRLLDIISNNAQKMAVLIDDLLKFSQLGRKPIETKKVDMRLLVNMVVDDVLKSSGSDKVEVKIGNLYEHDCDQRMMSHVFTNLISNAIKYSSKEESPRIEIDSHRVKNGVEYSIKDNGVGFDMKYAERIFGVFQRLHTESEFGGVGVGLAIVKRIITKHGGDVWVESEVGKGTTFYFYLPFETIETYHGDESRAGGSIVY